MIDLDHLLREAVARGASDLLLVPAARPTIRLHGVLTPLDPDQETLRSEDATTLLTPFLVAGEGGGFRDRSAADFCFDRAGIGRFRCNLHRTRDGVAAAIRLLPERIPDCDDLNLPKQVTRFAEILKGFVLIVGPTGAGKSTTIASLIQHINRERACHIVTIEDPVEYRLRHDRGLVEQIEIGADSPHFAEALRHVLRQDPDVIFVGEMRDLETISIALTAAETGHLVFSTLHTNDTSHAIERIIDAFPGSQQNQVRQQIALSLTGVIAQHLIPAADGSGRIPAVECLVATDGVRSLIRASRTHQLYTAIETGRAQGMVTLEESLAGLCRAGRITREEALRHASHTDQLMALLA